MATRIGHIASESIDADKVDAWNTALGTSLTVEQAQALFVAMVGDTALMAKLAEANNYLFKMRALLNNLQEQQREAQQWEAPLGEYAALGQAAQLLAQAMTAAYHDGDALAPPPTNQR